MDPESVAQEYVENLLELLSSNTDDLSYVEILGEVVILLDDYQQDLAIEDESNKNRKILSSSENDEDKTPITVNLNKTINRGFILDKATKLYYKNQHLTNDKFELLSPVDQTKHRKNITVLFQKLLLEENEKPVKETNLTDTPFKRDTSQDNAVDDDLISAEKQWYQEQIVDLKQKKRFCTVEIQELERQNKITKISGLIVSRNEKRIEELRNEKIELEKELKKYQEKL